MQITEKLEEGIGWTQEQPCHAQEELLEEQSHVRILQLD